MKAANCPPKNGFRAFVALRMNAGIEAAIEQFVDRLRPLSNSIRWVPRANLHLTLRFLGNEAPVPQLETLAGDLAVIAGQLSRSHSPRRASEASQISCARALSGSACRVTA